MKQLLLLMGNLVFGMGTVCGVFAVATKLSASEPAPIRLSSVYSEGIWTREPTRIDRSAQHYERIQVPDTKQAKQTQTREVSKTVQIASLDEADGAAAFFQQSRSSDAPNGDLAAMAVRHEQWCAQKYRSYRASDNSYRSFSGARRTCVSPLGLAGKIEANTGSPDVSEQASDPSLVDVAACKARYRSYNADDNTYQPFDGGPRRRCAL